MHDLSHYLIQISGPLNEPGFNSSSPLQIKVFKTDRDLTGFEVYTDQSGLIGLLRHLHHQGYHLLKVERQ